MKLIKPVIVTAFVVLGCLLMATFIRMLIISTGKPEAFRDVNGNILPGSISEKVFVTIGGVRQGMFIRTRNADNPVLLFLHGGPGFPNYFLFEKYNPGLEDFFTVCYREQRGGGLSWSGGTTIALPAVSKAPEIFHTYIAMGQIARQSESERIAFDYMLKRYTELNDRKSVNQLKKYGNLETEADLTAFYNSGVRDNMMHKLGIGTMHNMRSVFRDIFLQVWKCRAYTMREKYIIWKSKMAFLPETGLKTETLTTDFISSYPVVDVPIFFVSGIYDLTVNTGISKNYFDIIDAPLKRFCTFEHSAHGPLFEEPERFREVLTEWLLELSLEPGLSVHDSDE